MSDKLEQVGREMNALDSILASFPGLPMKANFFHGRLVEKSPFWWNNFAVDELRKFKGKRRRQLIITEVHCLAVRRAPLATDYIITSPMVWDAIELLKFGGEL